MTLDFIAKCRVRTRLTLHCWLKSMVFFFNKSALLLNVNCHLEDFGWNKRAADLLLLLLLHQVNIKILINNWAPLCDFQPLLKIRKFQKIIFSVKFIFCWIFSKFIHGMICIRWANWQNFIYFVCLCNSVMDIWVSMAKVYDQSLKHISFPMTTK